jgi:hypothetical protein
MVDSTLVDEKPRLPLIDPSTGAIFELRMPRKNSSCESLLGPNAAQGPTMR